ncbi:hypothetical protein Taro_008791 [Colocasia esculenta]|uniref:J domain-containing protein n=1 Tax=Colocasia esculenta TaxID=4460 RepID=A0A843TYI5_COLES|nr:hypothetical protein [Colocasia esculenta]
MIAASSSLSSCTAAPRSSGLHRHELLRRLPSLPQIRIPRSPQPPRSISASYASPAAERQWENTGAYYNYYSQSPSGGGSRVGEPTGTLSAAGSLYDVLGVSRCATSQEIKAAFRRLARERHPDVAAAGRKGASAEEFMRIHAAYSTLSDPEKRAEYDRRMTASAPRRHPPFFSSSAAAACSYYYRPASFDSASSSTFARRTWETDQCW